jgi:hypothetical protein
MANPKRQYDLDKIQSSKARHIIREAVAVVESLDTSGETRMAAAIDRLIRSRLASNATNSMLAADLRAAIAKQSR